MTADVRPFLIATLQRMNFPVEDLTDATPLGESGLELESLSFAELTLALEEQFGTAFADEELEQLGGLTFGAFVELVEQKARGEAPAQVGGAL